MPDPVQPSFLAQLAALRPLPEALPLLLHGAMAGAGGFVGLALWGGERRAFLRRFLPCAHGAPSRDALREAAAAPDPGLKARFANRVERLRGPAPATAGTGRRPRAIAFRTV